MAGVRVQPVEGVREPNLPVQSHSTSARKEKAMKAKARINRLENRQKAYDARKDNQGTKRPGSQKRG